MNLLLERINQAVPNVHLRRFLMLLCALFVVELGTGFISHLASDDPTPLSIARLRRSGDEAVDNQDIPTGQDQPEAVAFPAHAAARYLSDLSSEDLVALLTVTAPSDPDTFNLVKIENLVTRKPIAIVFAHPGREFHMQLPMAKYRLKFARGKTWYGEELLFGTETRAYVTNVVDLTRRRDGSTPSAQVPLQGFVDGTTRGGRGIKKEQF